MSRALHIRGITVALAALLSVSGALAGPSNKDRASLVTFEGVVTAVEEAGGDQDNRMDVARITLDGAESRELSIALAPRETLLQVEFEVRVGDRLKARVFLSDVEPVLAHKVMNLTRGTMIRLRTLTRVPLWDGRGQWQGGPRRDHRGGPGRGGRQGSRR